MKKKKGNRKGKKLYWRGCQLILRTKKTSWKLTNIILCLIAIVAISCSIILYINGNRERIKTASDAVIGDAIIENEPENETLEVLAEIVEEEKLEVKKEEPKKEEKKETVLNYRLTSYYTGDGTGSGATTASGKSTKDFQVNEKGWYTYKGKLVIATASKRLLSWSQYKNSTQRFFNLYDELILEIDGVRYEAIVLDVCGAAMKKPIIDLFVSNKASVKDTQIKVIIK